MMYSYLELTLYISVIQGQVQGRSMNPLIVQGQKLKPESLAQEQLVQGGLQEAEAPQALPRGVSADQGVGVAGLRGLRSPHRVAGDRDPGSQASRSKASIYDDPSRRKPCICNVQSKLLQANVLCSLGLSLLWDVLLEGDRL